MKRLIYNYGAYNLDITGPLMVMVQRVSGLAFSIHDGLACDKDKLTPYRKKYITLKKPTVIEYYGYLFQFQSILAGPNILFKDYVQFIDGSNFKTEDKVIHYSLVKLCISTQHVTLLIFFRTKNCVTTRVFVRRNVTH